MRIKKIMRKKQLGKIRGYTLIELMIVMLLLVLVGSLIAGILSSTITGAAKSKIVSDLGQNGNYALSLITDVIINAQDLQSVTDASKTTYQTCTPEGIPAKSLQLQGFDGGITTLACDDTGLDPTYTISSNSASLLDTSRVKLIAGSCTFTCVQADPYSIPRIDIVFQLTNASGSAFMDTISFSTSVAMRNQSIK